MNPLWVGVNPLLIKSEPPIRGFYQNMRPNTKEDACEHPLFLVQRKNGLERAAPVHTLAQKLRAGEQFLARGKVRGQVAAVSMTVDSCPLGLQ